MLFKKYIYSTVAIIIILITIQKLTLRLKSENLDKHWSHSDMFVEDPPEGETLEMEHQRSLPLHIHE